MGIFDIFKKKEQQSVPEPEKPEITFEGNTPYEKLQNLIVKYPNINLQKGEVCFYEGYAQSYRKKNVVTGYKGAGAGVSVRIAKGVSVHTGGSGRQAIREDVSEKHDAQFFITNKRLLLLADKYGFTVRIQSILQMQFKTDGMIIHTASKQHTLLSNDIEMIKAIIGLMNDAYKEAPN